MAHQTGEQSTCLLVLEFLGRVEPGHLLLGDE